MFNELELKEYFILKHRVPESAREYITTARMSEPSRMVGTRATHNSVSFVYSKKMQRTISTESRGPERLFALISEQDEDVIEYWDQPPPLDVTRIDSKGSERRSKYTPDFLVLAKNGPRLVEVKPLDKVQKMAKERPNEWVVDNVAETYRFLPAEKACEEIGIDFEVFIYSRDMRHLHSNLDLLAQLVDNDIDELNVDPAFEESYAWTLDDLRRRLNLSSFSPLLAKIVSGELYTDLDKMLVSEPKGCVVVRNRHLLTEAVEQFQAYKILDPELQETVDGKHFPCERYAENVLNKLSRIESGEKSRCTRRWKAQIRNGAELGLSKFQALIPRYASYRRTKLHPIVYRTLIEYLQGAHATSRGLNTYRSYARYCVIAKETHKPTSPVAWETFRRYAERLQQTTAFGRGGRRAGNAHDSPTDPAARLLRPGVPWQLAAIDHNLTKIYLTIFSSEGEIWVMKVWLTAMIDLCTKKVLAYALSFQPPSRRSVSLVIRDCVRRHGRLPAEIIVDRGSEFKSVYFASMCAHYGVTLTLRPASHPKYGSEVERLFGEFMQQYLTQLPGNTVDYDKVRSVDGKLKPSESAILEPYEFYKELEKFIHWRESKVVGVSDVSIAEKFSHLCEDYPDIGVAVEYDNDFLLVSSVENGRYKLDHRRGIHIDALHYWSPELAKIQNQRKRLDVRRDPENPHVIYAYVHDKWIPCLTSHASRFKSMDPVSQRCEVMKMVESKAAKVKIRQDADEALAAQILSDDQVRKAEKHIPKTHGLQNDSDLFSKNNVVELKIQKWG